MGYIVAKPAWMRKFYGPATWELPAAGNTVYLTFDDGPHPELTPFVLDVLKQHGAKGTFFCLGRQAQKHPELVERIRREGHSVGNHTWNHPDGWRTPNKAYYADVAAAGTVLHTRLFRPPHGHITPFQVRRLRKEQGLQVVMWNILSGDFDAQTSPQQCLSNVAENLRPGSIVVFHDNDAAGPNLKYALPRLLEDFSTKGYLFEAIPEHNL
ncbi:MAG: polysaccharide deacetylase family protein [Sphingobacteriales bacterium]|nr:MAG: polysaccharide deacetylase family protein [Sphingobacteriales bacterium]